MKHNQKYFAVALVCVVLGLALFGYKLSMPMMAEMLPTGGIGLLALLAIVFGNQRVRDERDELLRTRAGTTAFLVGLVLLVAGFLVKGFVEHEIDRFLQIAVLGMIIVWFIALEINKRKS